MSKHDGFFHGLEASAVLTIIGIALLFSTAIGVVLIAPNFTDPSWVQPTSHYQVQMYEVADPNFYIARSSEGSDSLEYVHHLKNGKSLLAFQEGEYIRILAPAELDKYVTHFGDKTTKLTSRLLLLREPEAINAAKAQELKQTLQVAWEGQNADKQKTTTQRPNYQVLELYDPKKQEAFSVAFGDGISESYIDANFTVIDGQPTQRYHKDPGVIFVKNPHEFRAMNHSSAAGSKTNRYNPQGTPVKNLAELTSPELGFLSRKQLIQMGENIFASEGCYYCHTDQTRTLIQDTVLNGSESYAAPPSSANEYIYQRISYAGTRRIGPDISRVGVKRPSRDWHKAHFWSPRTASLGSIMPSFRHFFDHDPRGTGKSQIGVPNHLFEAIYQYLMTKGTRITSPTQAWWLGKDPIRTTQIIEGRRGVRAP